MVRVHYRPVRALLLLSLASCNAALAQAPNAAATTSETAGTAETEDATDPHALAVSVGHVESDNIARTPVATSGSYDSFGVFANLAHTSTRVTTSINTDLEFRTYSEDAIEDETVGTLAALIDLDLVRDVFSWDFRENYSQGLRDPFAPLGPDNRESINVIASGPQLDLPLGGRTTLALGADYSARRYDQSSNVDSDAAVYELGILRDISQTTVVGLIANASEIDYADFDAPPYDIDRLYFRYDKTLASGRVLAEVGTNEITLANNKTSEPLINFEWSRALATRSHLTINAASEFTDSGGLASPTDSANPITPGEVLVSANPFEQRRFAVSYVVTMTRTDVSFQIGRSEELYVGNSAIDTRTTTTEATFHRAISEKLDLGAAFRKQLREPEDSTILIADGEDTTFSAWLNRSLGRRFNVGIAWSKYERSETGTFDEQRYEIRFAYSPTGSGAAAMRSVGR